MNSKDIFSNVKLTKNQGFGTSIIDHEIRNEFSLTLSEYCVIDVIVQRKVKKKDTTLLDITTFLGITGNIAEQVVSKLIEKKTIKDKTGKLFVSKKIYNRINNINDFSNDFEEFWTIKEGDKIRTAWPGPKKKAYDLYMKARKNKRSHRFIMDQRMWYFKILEIQTFRSKMMATRFLNIDSGELDQDFKLFYDEISKKKEKESNIGSASAMTSEDFKKQFRDDQ